MREPASVMCVKFKERKREKFLRENFHFFFPRDGNSILHDDPASFDVLLSARRALSLLINHVKCVTSERVLDACQQ